MTAVIPALLCNTSLTASSQAQGQGDPVVRCSIQRNNAGQRDKHTRLLLFLVHHASSPPAAASPPAGSGSSSGLATRPAWDDRRGVQHSRGGTQGHSGTGEEAGRMGRTQSKCEICLGRQPDANKAQAARTLVRLSSYSVFSSFLRVYLRASYSEQEGMRQQAGRGVRCVAAFVVAGLR